MLLVIAGILWQSRTIETTPVREQLPVTTNAPEQRHRIVITYQAKAGETSLDQLKLEADNVITKDSEYGEYVDSIEGNKSGIDGKYWSFYIDGTMATVGAGSYVQNGGEAIEWKYQKL